MFRNRMTILRLIREAADAASGGGGADPSTAPPEGEAPAADASPASSGGQQTLLGDGGEQTGSGEDSSSAATSPEPLTMESFTLPEGFTVPEETQADFLAAVNDESLSKGELITKLLGMQAAAQSASVEAASRSLQETWDAQQNDWRNQSQALPNIGGANLDKTVAQIKTGLGHVNAPPEFFKMLTETGVGNHPQMISVLHALVQPHLERTPSSGNPTPEVVSSKTFNYPSMEKK